MILRGIRRALFGFLWAPAALAALGSPAAESPPCDAAPFRDFDFWIGNWDVTDADGSKVGTNRISSEEAGCVLIESWRSTGGVTGRSMNFYDPSRRVWRQIWVSPGSQIEIEGNLLGAHMVLVGHIRYLKDGSTRPFRGTWTLLPDGRVRQYFEESHADDGAWTIWFEGFYLRSESRPESQPESRSNLDNAE